MRILIDTNILIPLETPQRVLDEEYSNFINLAQGNCIIFIHKANFDDIDRYKNKIDLKIIQSRLKKYRNLEFSKKPDSEFLKIINSKHDTPRVISDDELLYALYEKSVQILLSNDKGIYEKAKLANIDSRVYRLEQIITFLENTFQSKAVENPNIEEVFLYSINVNNSIFDSVKREYKGFIEWFNEKSEKGRKAWIVKKNSGGIEAICIHKEESQIQALEGKILKLCTFIVEEKSRGKRLGELLLKIAFDYATKNNYIATYVELFPKNKDFLISLLKDFGFQKFGKKENQEIYIKYFFIEDKISSEKLKSLDFANKYFPLFKNSNDINKFIIPIIPEYHKRLFPEDQLQFPLFNLHEILGNSIKKAYVCNSVIKKMNIGDIIIFYRSKDVRSISNIGIIEDIIRTKDLKELASFVGKRSVYSYNELKEICKSEALAILFKHIRNFDNKINYKKLKKDKIINGPIQSITRIDNKKFLKIFEDTGGKIDNCFSTDKAQLCI